MPTPPTRPTGHALRGDIEGLRAIAVLMVLLYHLRIPGLSGGFAGVDVFFVISGYLITNLLVKEAKRTGTISIADFYARRARRLLPAATVVLIFTALMGWWLLPSTRHGELGWDVGAAALYVVNWALASRSVDYLAEDSGASLVQHYWSLSVEEQFYVVWPLMIIIGLVIERRLRLKNMGLIRLLLVITVIASFAWSVIHTADDPGQAYFVTTTRVWELGIGALLVFASTAAAKIPRQVAEMLAVVGLVMIAICIVVISTSTPWPGSAALLPTVGTALVIAAGLSSQHTVAARALGVRPMRFIGGLSYGLYLWHWPVLLLLDEVRPEAGAPLRILTALGCVGLSWLTLRLVEDPIRFSPHLSKTPGRGLMLGAAGMALSVGAAGAVWASAPRLVELSADTSGGLSLVGRHDAEGIALVKDPAALYTRSGPVNPPAGAAAKDVPSAYPANCQILEDETELRPDDDCVFGPADATLDVALVGDSKLLQWFPALLAIAQDEGWRLKVYTKSGCGFVDIPGYPECQEFNAALAPHLGDGEHTPDVIITSMLTRGKERGAELAENLRPAAEAGAQIVFLTDNPFPRHIDEVGMNSIYECVAEFAEDYSACSYVRYRGAGTPGIVAAHELMPDSKLIDMSKWICPPDTTIPGAPDDEARCPAVIDGVLIYRQGSHLTATYVRTLTPILHDALAREGIAKTPREDVPWRIPTADEVDVIRQQPAEG